MQEGKFARNLSYTLFVGSITEACVYLCCNESMENQSEFLDEWPRVSFSQLAQEEVGGEPLRMLYKSFFALLRFPETILLALLTILKAKP